MGFGIDITLLFKLYLTFNIWFQNYIWISTWASLSLTKFNFFVKSSPAITGLTAQCIGRTYCIYPFYCKNPLYLFSHIWFQRKYTFCALYLSTCQFVLETSVLLFLMNTFAFTSCSCWEICILFVF